MAAERHIPFNALPESTRTRLLASLASTGNPAPIFASSTGTGVAVFLWGLLAVGALAPAFVLADEFGNPNGDFGILGFGGLLAVLPCAWLFVYALLGAARRAVVASRSPVPMGVYVFPIDVVDTRGKDLRILPLAGLTKLDAVHNHTNGIYTNTAFTLAFEGGASVNFVVSGKQKAEAKLDELNRARNRVGAAARAGRWDEIAALDPFADARAGDDWDTLGTGPEPKPPRSGPKVAPIHALWWKPWLPAIPAAAVLAPLFVLGFNLASDAAMFANVQDYPSIWSAEGYLRNGWLHVDEVRDEWLPRAKLEEARRDNNVGRLRAFLVEYPEHHFAADARAAIHDIYTAAIARFAAEAASDDPRTVPVVTALLQWGEANGSPDLAVRYVPPSLELLAEMDAFIAKEGGKEGNYTVVPVSPHFSAEAVAGREESVTRHLQEGFGLVFAADVVNVVHGGRVDTATREAVVARPTIDVSYLLEPGGQLYTSEGDTRAFVGVNVYFVVDMRVPGSDEQLRFSFVAEPPEEFTVGTGLVSSDPASATVYDVMADHAYSSVAERLRGAFFRQPAATAGAGEGAVPEGGIDGAALDALVKAALAAQAEEEATKE